MVVKLLVRVLMGWKTCGWIKWVRDADDRRREVKEGVHTS